MSADLLGSTAQDTVKSGCARPICVPVGNKQKTLEILVFPACARFGRGIRLTEKDTVNKNPSKVLENKTKSAIWPALKGYD